MSGSDCRIDVAAARHAIGWIGSQRSLEPLNCVVVAIEEEGRVAQTAVAVVVLRIPRIDADGLLVMLDGFRGTAHAQLAVAHPFMRAAAQRVHLDSPLRGVDQLLA